MQDPKGKPVGSMMSMKSSSDFMAGKTYAKEYPHSSTSFLQPIYISDDAGSDGHSTRGSECLYEPPDHELRNTGCKGYSD